MRLRSAPGYLIWVAVLAVACTGTESEEQPETTTSTEEDVGTSSSLAPVDAEPTVISGEESFPDGFTIAEGETWVFDPEADTTVTVSANVVVLGELVMQPASADVEHVLRFEGVDESVFQGGGMDPVESDVGLWVMGAGRLLIEGTEKTAWAYEYDPAWEGDEVVAAPNTPGDTFGFAEVTSTPPPNELGYPTELLNLTRNVRIEGTPEGRAHVFIRSTQPQTIRYAALRHVGPDPGAFGSDTDTTGRYGLHFHHSGDGSQGTIVEGVVVRDTAAHAFVPHASHGITFQDTIAYFVRGEAYWWDTPPTEDDTSNDTNDAVWDRAVAAGVIGASGGNNHRLTGFFLGRGQNVSVTNSVAVGIQDEGGSDRSGFQWPENAEATWIFEDNVAHNNGAHGIFTWQNNEIPHVIDGFTAYYNELSGVEHGAYRNSYVYKDLTLLENGVAVVSHALGKPEDDGSTDTQVWANLRTDGGFLIVERHNLKADTPVRFLGCDFAGVFVTDAEAEPGLYDIIDCGLEPEDFDLAEAHAQSVFRVQREDDTAYELRGDGTVTEIDAFYEEAESSG